MSMLGRGKLATQLVMVDMRKGEEYVNAFKDVQRLEEKKGASLKKDRLPSARRNKND